MIELLINIYAAGVVLTWAAYFYVLYPARKEGVGALKVSAHSALFSYIWVFTLPILAIAYYQEGGFQ